MTRILQGKRAMTGESLHCTLRTGTPGKLRRGAIRGVHKGLPLGETLNGHKLLSTCSGGFTTQALPCTGKTSTGKWQILELDMATNCSSRHDIA
jgi:hypothetical protein